MVRKHCALFIKLRYSDSIQKREYLPGCVSSLPPPPEFALSGIYDGKQTEQYTFTSIVSYNNCLGYTHWPWTSKPDAAVVRKVTRLSTLTAFHGNWIVIMAHSQMVMRFSAWWMGAVETVVECWVNGTFIFHMCWNSPPMIRNLKDLVFLQRDSWRATHALAQDGSQAYIMLIVSFPGPHQASLQCCNKWGWGLGMRLIISLNSSASLKKCNYYKMQGTITFKFKSYHSLGLIYFV